MKSPIITCFALVVVGFTCCSTDLDNVEVATQEASVADAPSEMTNTGLAQVTGVTVSGTANNYTFSVTIESPDTGCAQYADWWEVITSEGDLIYRRVLGHSHVEEQPFTRSGGTIGIPANEEVYIRAHMNTSGYGTSVLQGSVTNGFAAANLDADFANALAQQQPLPTSCAF